MLPKYIVCDVDNTVCKSASLIENRTAEMLARLSQAGHVFIFISGTDVAELRKMIPVEVFNGTESEVYYLGNSGATAHELMFTTRGGPYVKLDTRMIYEELIDPEDVLALTHVIQDAINTYNIPCLSGMNDQILLRGSQVTLSCIGRTADYALKKAYDPSLKVREEIGNYLAYRLEQEDLKFSIKIGGTTSIDISKGNFDKKIGLEKLFKVRGMTPDECIFFGDMICEGGNDLVVTKLINNYVKVEDYLDFHSQLAKLSQKDL